MITTLPYLKRVTALYAAIALILGLVPGTGVSLLSATLGVSAVVIAYGYFAVLRHLF